MQHILYQSSVQIYAILEIDRKKMLRFLKQETEYYFIYKNIWNSFNIIWNKVILSNNRIYYRIVEQ